VTCCKPVLESYVVVLTTTGGLISCSVVLLLFDLSVDPSGSMYAGMLP
jgi:hypothetical protein